MRSNAKLLGPIPYPHYEKIPKYIVTVLFVFILITIESPSRLKKVVSADIYGQCVGEC